MDRPANSQVHTEEYEYWGDKVEVTLNVTRGTFERQVNAREHELSTGRRSQSISLKEALARGLKTMFLETDIPWLEKSASPTPNSRFLIFKKDASESRMFKEEGYVLAGTTLLKFGSEVEGKDIQKSIQLSTDVYRSISYRENWSIPGAPGFCVNGALIGGPYRNSEELTQTWILQPGRPSLLYIHMRDAVDVDEHSSLLNNLPSLEQELSRQGYSSAVKILRKGKRTVAGMEAEEVLFSLQENGVQLYRFNLLVPGKAKSGAHPHTTIQLNFGNVPKHGLPPEQATSLVDEAGAFEVWDTLLNSMRLRPGAL